MKDFGEYLSVETEQFVPQTTKQSFKTKELPTKHGNVKYKTDTRQETIPELLDRASRLGGEGHAFFAVDLGEVVRRIEKWRALLPRVEPFYAMKCNNNVTMLKTLVELGVSFDCASKEEMATALKLGVEPSNIIFANPCKPIPFIKYAEYNEVEMMTFDNEDELLKISEHYPNAKMVLRILTDDSRSVCRFGAKFGASFETAKQLLKRGQELGMNIMGVSFHVGSGCFDPTAFSDAVQVAKSVFDEAEKLGMKLSLLDLGGGFPGLDGIDGAPFEDVAACLRESLDIHFPETSNVRIIAEPGRYVAAAAFTLAVCIQARRVIKPKDENEKPSYMYYVNDGVYGSFNCLIFDHAKIFPRVLRLGGDFQLGQNELGENFETSLWGPTCDSMDCISKKESLPELNIGDWLYFENMGAYTLAAATTFNGIPQANLYFTNTEA